MIVKISILAWQMEDWKQDSRNRTNENSALFKHSFLTDHNINFSNPKILAKDSSSFRLQIKETLKIKEHCAYNSLNANIGSFKLNLW